MNRKIINLLIIATAVFISGVQEAISRPNFLAEFENKYPVTIGTKIDSCEICHISNITNIPLNPYGVDYQKTRNFTNLESRIPGNFTFIEMKDSDNDGFTNIQEIRNLTFPGDPNDKPGSLNPNIIAASPTTVQTTATVTPPPAVTTVAKTPGFEMALTLIALLAIFMGRNKL